MTQSSMPRICQRCMKVRISLSILVSFSESDISLVMTALMPLMAWTFLLPDLPEGMARISTTSTTSAANAAWTYFLLGILFTILQLTD